MAQLPSTPPGPAHPWFTIDCSPVAEEAPVCSPRMIALQERIMGLASEKNSRCDRGEAGTLARLLEQSALMPEEIERMVTGLFALGAVSQCLNASGTTNLGFLAQQLRTPEAVETVLTQLPRWRTALGLSDEALTERNFEGPFFSRNSEQVLLGQFFELVRITAQTPKNADAAFPSTTEFQGQVDAQLALLQQGQELIRQGRSELGGWWRVTHAKLDPANLAGMHTLIDTVASTDLREALHILKVCVGYAPNHPFPPETARALGERLPSLLRTRHSEVDLLQIGNTHGMFRGEYGCADFALAALSSKASAPTIALLRAVARTIPATDAGRLDQNRKDALALPFGSLRDLVHDHRPYVHELVSAMVRYFNSTAEGVESHGLATASLEAAISKTDPNYTNNPNTRALLLDLTKYSLKIGSEISVIDRLRRLATNTSPRIAELPTTEDRIWNAHLRAVKGAIESGERVVLHTALRGMTLHLESEQAANTTSLSPHKILSYGWIDQALTPLLQRITFEEQWGIHRAPWFHEVLRFQELTASPHPYDPKQFEQFIAACNQLDSEEALRLVMDRCLLERLSPLAKEFRRLGHPDWVEALWSGNIDHELTTLTSARNTETIVGERYRRVRSVQRELRQWGD